MRGHSIPDRNRTPSDFISFMPRFHLALGKIYPPQTISFFSGLPQKICFAKILREEERPAVKRVKARLRTFTAERLRRDESGERSSKMHRKHLKPIECGEGLQIAVAGARNRSEPFLGLSQRFCGKRSDLP